MITVAQPDLANLESALNKEWLETNSLGGYASSTVVGINTRRYHGLLVAALKPPVDRILLVSRVDEVLIIGKERYEISSSEYENTVYPKGYRYLEEVRLDLYPTFTYVVGGVKLNKSVLMLHGENTTYITYSIETSPNGPRTSQIILEVRPLVAFRDHHSLLRENPGFSMHTNVEPGITRLRPYEHLPQLCIIFDSGRFEGSGYWYRNYHYRREKERGYPSNEDLYSPGRILFTFEEGDSQELAFSTERVSLADLRNRSIAEVERRTRILESPIARHDLRNHLLLAADSFIAKRGDNRTIIAGYPWFTDWGRHAMVSLPGLTLVTGRYDDAKGIISTYLRNMNLGLIPSHFPDFSRDAAYDSIDAGLWLIEAVKKYHDYTGDGGFIASILPDLRDIVQHYLEGTLYSIKVDDDGLLQGGMEGTELTWMNAKVADRVITPRMGKPVEVNALWYNALRIMADLCAEFGGLAEESKYDYLARQVFENFNRDFWNQAKNCLYDLITKNLKDDSIRPNQIFALSLTNPVLAVSKWMPVLEVVERELLTPYGLRTLSPDDPNYVGTCKGNLEARDRAYHQGTVWPWLLGHYIMAYIRVHGRSTRTIAYCSRLLELFIDHVHEAGLGNISEIFDGDPPHAPRGCIAQAWSVAEILRVVSGDLLQASRTDHQHHGNISR
jgi:predicted glycogen debranching enzyme